MSDLFLTRDLQQKDTHLLKTYEANDGYVALRKALEMTPEAVLEEVKKSNLRGRGGAGFPTGMKWSFLPKGDVDAAGKPRPKYLVCNADEGEPGTFKDRMLLTRFPHMLIEGMAIAAYAVGSHKCFIYIRGEFHHEARVFIAALEEAKRAGYVGKSVLGKDFLFDVVVYRGAGAYICGEETGLLSSLEGKRGEPKVKPPFPAQVGAFGMPTCVNNVETLCAVPFIIREGAQKFASVGTEKSGGTRLFCLSGHVEKPGIYERPVNINLKQLIADAGGVLGGKAVKAVIPGGASAPMLSANEIDVAMDFDALAKAGTMAGSGGVIVLAEGTCVVAAAARLLKFYEHESCGQCSQCREGSHWLARMFHRIENGGGTPEDLDKIAKICGNMAGQTICAFADAVTGPALSAVRKFRDEFEQHVKLKRCPLR